MPGRRLGRGLVLAVSLFVLSHCAPSSRPASPPDATHDRGVTRRVVLVSFDAVGGERLAQLLARPTALPAGGFRAIAQRGFYAVRSVPPSPSLTAVSHVTHVTGALPQATGIVSNWMHDWSRPFGTAVSGFQAPIRAETLWQAARRQGKRTGVMLYPGADATAPERTADFGMAYPGDPIAWSKLHTLDAAAWQPLEPRPAGSFSPGRRAALPFEKASHSVTVMAVDHTDDGRVNYDRLRVESPDGRAVQVRPGEWFTVEVPSEAARTGAWCKVLTLAPDLSHTEIYLGALAHSVAYPPEFQRTLDAQVGFWPSAPDSRAFGANSGRTEAFLEQAERIADFITRAQLVGLSRTDWDLMLMYNVVADETGHEFLLADPRQPGFSPERARRLQELVDRGFALADRSLRAIDRALTPNDSIFVTSDHGMTPIWRELFPNEILREAGFVKVDADGSISPESSAFAVTSGGMSHVYINRAADREALLPALEKLFREFRVDAESPWEQIVRREAAGPLGLDAPESGDLMVVAKPGGVVARAVRPRQGPIGVPDHLGAHGYLNRHPQIHATLLAAGPGISVSRVEQVDSWEIAARVAAAIGIEPPRQAAPSRW